MKLLFEAIKMDVDTPFDAEEDANVPVGAVPLVRAMIQKGLHELAPFHDETFVYRPTTGRTKGKHCSATTRLNPEASNFSNSSDIF